MNAINILERIIQQTATDFSLFSEEEWNKKPAPNKWSKKEILGHLIDSEYNNHVRIVKSVSNPSPIHLEKYAQDEWVKRNNYQSVKAETIFNSWKIHQESMVTLLKTLSNSELQNHFIISDDNKVTLEWLINDYAEHQLHHLRQIFNHNFLSDIIISYGK